MSRPKGRRNDDFDATRDRILERAGRAMLEPGGATLSFRQLADAAEVSPNTLRHYFHDRSELTREVLASWHRLGLPFLHEAATRAIDDVKKSLRWFVGFVLEGWTAGVGAMHETGLTVGLRHDDLGPAYVTELLEPTLVVAESRIARHVADGQLGPCDVRFAAIELIAPVFTVLLHQKGLNGVRCRPLDIDAFVTEHIDRFLRAYATQRSPEPATRRN